MFKFTQAVRKAIILLTILMLVNTEIMNTRITTLRSKHQQESKPRHHHHSEHVIFDGPSEEVTLKLNFKFDKDLKHFTVEQVQYSDSDVETQEEIQEVVSTSNVKTESKWINQSYIVDAANAGAQENVPRQIRSELSAKKLKIKEANSEEKDFIQNQDHSSLTTTHQESSPPSTNELPSSPKKSENPSEKSAQKDTHAEEPAVSSGPLSDKAVPASTSSSPASVESNSSSTQTQSAPNVEASSASPTENEGATSKKESTIGSKEVDSSPASTSQSSKIPSDVPNLMIAPEIHTLPQPKETPVQAESHPQIFIAPAPRKPILSFTREQNQEIDEKEEQKEGHKEEKQVQNEQHKEQHKEEHKEELKEENKEEFKEEHKEQNKEELKEERQNHKEEHKEQQKKEQKEEKKEEKKEEQKEQSVKSEPAQPSSTVQALPEATISLNEVDIVGDVGSQSEVTNSSTIKLTDYPQTTSLTTSEVQSQANETTNSTASALTDPIQSVAVESTPSTSDPIQPQLATDEVKPDPETLAISAASPSDSNDIEPLDSAPTSSLTSEQSSPSWSLFGN